MGSKLRDETVAFGEFFIQNDNENFVFIQSNFTEPHNLQIIVQDKAGRSIITKNHLVDESTTELKLDVSSCMPGEHHAWMYFADKIVVRDFKKENPAKANLLERFFKIFK